MGENKRDYFTQCPNFILYGLPQLPLQDKWTLLTLIGRCPDCGPYKLSTREIAAIAGVKHNVLRSMDGKTPREGILERIQRITGYITLVEGKPINIVTRLTGRAQTYIYIHHDKIWKDNSAFYEAQTVGMHRAVSEQSFECISGFCTTGTVHDVNSKESKDSKNTVHNANVNVHDVNSKVHVVNVTVHDVTLTVHDASTKGGGNTINTINNTLNTNNTISLDSVEKGKQEKDFSPSQENDEWRIADEDEEKTQELPSLQAVDELTQKRQAIKVPPAPPVAPPPAPASSKPSPPKEVPPQSPPTTRNRNTRSKTDNPPKQAALPIVLSDGASLVWNGWSGMYWFKNAAPKLTETAASRSEELAKAGLGTIGLDALEEIKQIVAFGQKRFKDRYANRGFELGDIVWLRPKWLSSRPASQQQASPSSSSNNTPSQEQTPKSEAERIMMEDEQKYRDGLILWTRTVDDNLRQFLKTPRSDYDVWCNLTAAICWEWMTQEEALAHAWPKHRGFTDRERRSILEAQRRREKQAA